MCRLRKLSKETWLTCVVASLCLSAAPTAYANVWGEPWGSFSWVPAFAVPVPTMGIWALGTVAVATALLGVSRFK